MLAAAGSAQVSQYPAGFLMDRNHIRAVKQSLGEKKKLYAPMYQYLIREAQKGLDAPLTSVMEKKQIPPSGDKHDFMSLAPYHWPDPSKAGGIPYMRKDGQRNPEMYEIPDQDYFPKICKRIYQLSLAYYFSGEKKYADKAVFFLKGWFINADTKMNPNMNYAQAVKGVSEGRGSGIIESRDLIFVVEALTLLDDGKALDAGVQSQMKAWLNEFLVWLRTSKNGKQEAGAKNNHGTWYAAQALSLALCLDLPDSVNSILKDVENRIAWQIEQDGSQPLELARTTSLGYSHFNVLAMSILFKLAENTEKKYSEFATPDGRSLKKAVEFLYPFTSGEEEWKHEQIKEPNKKELSACYHYAFYFWKDKKFIELAKRLDEDELRKSILMLTLSGAVE